MVAGGRWAWAMGTGRREFCAQPPLKFRLRTGCDCMSWWGPRWGCEGVGGACNWKPVARWALELNEPMHVGSQEALGVGEGDVEAWVVRAIGKKLLEARIDQMRRTVAVTKCAQRTFSTAQWRALLAQLGAWKVCSQAIFWGGRANRAALLEQVGLEMHHGAVV